MKPIFWIGSCIALSLSMSAACSSDDGEDDVLGGAPGDGDGDLGGNGGEINGDGDDVDCSTEVTSGLGGLGGMGGQGILSCEAPEPPDVRIELDGTYSDDWGSTHTVTHEYWDTGYLRYYFSRVDNERNFALARNPSDDMYFPCMWSRFVWTEQDGNVYVCQAPYSAGSECIAHHRPMPDAGDLDAGCDGFAWTQLSAE